MQGDRFGCPSRVLVSEGKVAAGAQGVEVFGNRVAESGLDRAYQGKREPDHRTSE